MLGLALSEVRRRARTYVPAGAVSAGLALLCIRAILASAGEAAVPLDDAFIHFQYARRLAEGHFFSYAPEDGYTTGATSFLWPMLLAPFHAAGARGLRIIFVAWLFGTVAHAGLAVEAYRITLRLAGRSAAVGTAAMCLLFGAFAWFAWSGMETLALGWLLLRTARVAGEACEEPAPASRRNLGTEAHLLVLATLAPLVRPEGALASLIAALALGLRPRAGGFARRLLALGTLVGPAALPLQNLLFAGHAASSTAEVKWMVINPYYGGPYLASGLLRNARLLATNILNGGEWTSIFLPEGSSYPILLGLVALPIAAIRRRAFYPAVFVALVALGTLIPCSYMSFLWNRLRYIWPFAGAWFVLLGCLAREVGDLVRWVRPRATYATPLLAGAFAGILGVRLPLAVEDLARSARAIDRQQVELGKWARSSLPLDARIGVNDTGAIAYLSDRKTFDIVGLTTEGESRYWTAGAASRFEHYERMPRSRLPTHFIVYPEWMACSVLLGERLHEASVWNQSILGGATMVAYKARYDTLGTGALPAAAPPGAHLLDELDVADIDSEAAHRFDLRGAFDVYEIVASTEVQGGSGTPGEEAATREITDGGRTHRTVDRFGVRLPSGAVGARMVLRVMAEDDVSLEVALNGTPVGIVAVEAGDIWSEPGMDIPGLGEVGAGEITVTARARTAEGKAEFTSFHYWFFSRS